jgi:galactofuranosylgalactofuranosylrhamnosyl-N-acetylglucosaminyl-diphospho-decaprenol beta-1,5/1,6-galactofuranosyltransferase
MVLYTQDSTARGSAVGPEEQAGRLLAQRTLFAGPSPDAPVELYAKPTKGVIVRERGTLVLDGHAAASTNTFFGRFPASYWQRWTSAGSVTVSATVTGSGHIRLMASDSEGEERTVSSRRIDDGRAESVELTATLDKFVDGGGLWLEFETTTGGLTIERVRWSVDSIRPRRSTAVVICTFNRADDCLATLQTLASDDEVAAELDAVYVVDQGTDTVESREGFAAVAERLGSTLRYVRQPNLGGAGGFTRGIYEALREDQNAQVNLLLMDDDIRLEPDTVVRMRGLADRADEPVIVGGQMLKLLHPDRLHVGAETVVLDILRAGLPVPDALTDADVSDEQQEIRVDADYNAWWSCLIPSEVVAAVGYPLPLFFQWDDIELGLRARGAGFPTVTLPGAGVWHAEFSWKNWDDWSRYFSYRNSLITSALHSDFDRRSIAIHLTKQLVEALVSMRYGLAALLIKGVEDFLKGPDVLKDGGVDTVGAVRKVWTSHPETKNHPANAVPGLSSVGRPRTTPPGTPSMLRAVLVKRILWQLLGKPRGTAAVPASDAEWWHVALFDTAVVTDPSQEGVRVRRFDRKQMTELARSGAAVLRRFVREGERVRDEYRRALPVLTARETWTRLFETR